MARRGLLDIFLFCVSALATVAANAAVDYQIYVVRPVINNNAILDDEALPAVCRDEKVLKIMACRGEYEPASFLVETDQPLKQVMVRAGQLSGPAGVLAPETVDVRIAQKFIKEIHAGCKAIPWLLVHDPGMLKIVDKYPKWVLNLKDEFVGPPDARRSLVDYRAGYSKINQLVRPLVDTQQLQPADIQFRRQFWLTVHVPDDAPSGIYRTALTVSAANAPDTTLNLEVTVPGFDLLPPKFEYSAYYPAMLLEENMREGTIARRDPRTHAQFLGELQNMMAHGCTNPCVYSGVDIDENGELDFTNLAKHLDLREQAGMVGGPLYIFQLWQINDRGLPMLTRDLTAAEWQRNVEVTRKIVAWVKARGYSDVYFMGIDEASGEKLRGERDTFASIREGGGKIWVSSFNGFFEVVGDLLDCAVLFHPGAGIVDQHQQWQVPSRDFLLRRQHMLTYDPHLLLMPQMQKVIKDVHKNGFKIFTYSDPQPPQPLPELHRRNRGLGLWKTGIDGTMAWAYCGLYEKDKLPDDADIKDGGVMITYGFVLRGPEGVFDTLSWEAYREGYDDARYLATLQDAMAKAAGKHRRLVARTERWLGDLTVNADLDAWRLEMARRTEALLKP